MSGNRILKRLDWTTVFLLVLLNIFGWVNIYSTTLGEESLDSFSFSTYYGKQLIFILLSYAMLLPILLIETRFLERFSSVFYLSSIVLLILLFPLGKTIGGATSWFNLGFFNFQPSELAKVTTALALAKYLTDIQTDIKLPRHQLYGVMIIAIPAVLTILQPDPGSALIFFSLFIVLFKEGLPGIYLLIGLMLVALFIFTLKFGIIWVIIGLIVLIALVFLFKKPHIRIPVFPLMIFVACSVLFSLSVNFVYNNLFEQRHRDRFSLWLAMEKDPERLSQIKKDFGYNKDQAEKAIESGGFSGKGFLEGTRTKGDFVPEQHTDYIFSSVGEEWGFLGTSGVVVLFTVLLLRLNVLAERQKRDFSRVFGYGIIAILLAHYAVNIGMVLGLLPTIGIPLPLFSYGGSGQLFFILMVFIFLKLDANRLRDDI